MGVDDVDMEADDEDLEANNDDMGADGVIGRETNCRCTWVGTVT